MPPKKLTERKINYLIKDEKKAAKEYKKMGLPQLAADEKRHAAYFEKLKKQAKT